MLIATIGLCGVMLYTVARRWVKIGVRMAVAADRATVVRLIVREADLSRRRIHDWQRADLAAQAADTFLFGLTPRGIGVDDVTPLGGAHTWPSEITAHRLVQRLLLTAYCVVTLPVILYDREAEVATSIVDALWSTAFASERLIQAPGAGVAR